MAKLKYTCLICGRLIDDVPPGFDDDPLVCLDCAIEEEEDLREDWLIEADPEDEQ
jgi:DNA-directed RNA polymerase subunit RPC12/RpoP